nr:hypothetical protein [Marinicella sp. W31]MDC2876920.1 hypothetical protein [Marinicella sp. W31]
MAAEQGKTVYNALVCFSRADGYRTSGAGLLRVCRPSLFALPIVVLVASQALAAAGLLCLYGENRPVRFIATGLTVWFCAFVLFRLSAFGLVAAVASYYLADIAIAVVALYFLHYHAHFDEVRFHRSISWFLSIEATTALVIVILYLYVGPTVPFQSTLTSITLISSFILFQQRFFWRSGCRSKSTNLTSENWHSMTPDRHPEPPWSLQRH